MNKVFTIITGELEENCYLLINDDNFCVIVDPGNDNELIRNKIEIEKLKPIAIILTHGHYDHVDAVGFIKNEYDIPVYMHKDDEFLVNGKFIPDFNCSEVSKIDGFHLKMYHTPGHSQGSVCYLSEDILFTGDTLFMGTVGRCDLEGGSFIEMLKSLELILNEFDDNIKIFPGHGPSSYMYAEKYSNPYLLKLKK